MNITAQVHHSARFIAHRASALRVADNEVLAPAAGGMFDFGITLPFVAITFLTMMAVLNALFYAPVIRDFKDTVYPFFESDTWFLECLFVLFLVV